MTPSANATIEARRYLMYVVRPLGTPAVALLGASYRSAEITRHFADAQLGVNGVILMFDQRQATLQTVTGAAARRPRTGLLRTDMYDAMQRGDGGTWVGPTSVDNVVRLHAWAKVPGRDSVVVVATPLAQAMAPAQSIADGTKAVALTGSAVVAAAGVMVIWGVATLRANRRRERQLERAQADLAAAQTDISGNRLRATTATAQLRALLDGVTEAAAVFDTELRLATWNDRFLAAAGLEDDTVREGLPFDQLIRQQCLAGLFGPQADTEAEVARRTQTLLAAEPDTSLTQTGPDGTQIPILARRMPDAGLVLILGGLAAWQPPPRAATPASGSSTTLALAEETIVEW
jgi:PAS domain-containing protein